MRRNGGLVAEPAAMRRPAHPVIVADHGMAARAGGDHGYDDAPRALPVANGPAFRPGVRLAIIDGVHAAPLLRGPVGLPPDGGADGSDAPLRKAILSLSTRPTRRW